MVSYTNWKTHHLNEASNTPVERSKRDKEPSEADRLRDTQRQQVVSMIQRQANDMLQAKTRDLQTKTRDELDKVLNRSAESGIVMRISGKQTARL